MSCKAKRASNIVGANNVPSPPTSTAIALPDSSPDYTSNDKADEKPYEKIRIFQSEIYYHNRPKNWSLPLNQQPTMMAAFDTDDDIAPRSPSYPNSQEKSINNNNYQHEIKYRTAIKKPISNIYPLQVKGPEQETKAVFFRNNTPPIPPVKRFTKEQVDAARVRAQQIIDRQRRSPDYIPHRHSSALLISQV